MGGALSGWGDPVRVGVALSGWWVPCQGGGDPVRVAGTKFRYFAISLFSPDSHVFFIASIRRASFEYICKKNIDLPWEKCTNLFIDDDFEILFETAEISGFTPEQVSRDR